VRYHLAGVPYDLDPEKFALRIKGKVDQELSLSLVDLRRMPATEIVAVNQCSGNSRGFFEPRVAGGQLGNGALGNARWHGPRGVGPSTILTITPQPATALRSWLGPKADCS
jgi:sulfite dehydrogenase (cytochrome) subunit A